MFFIVFLEREEGRERERSTDVKEKKHGAVVDHADCAGADHGPNLQPRDVP